MDEATRLAVRAEQIRTLYRQSAVVFLMNPINVIVVAIALRDTVPRLPLLTWVAVMVAITTMRMVLRWRYHRINPSPEQTDVWQRRFVAGVAATGLTWGLGAGVIYQYLSPMTQLLVLFVVGGTTAGAAGTLSFYVPAFIAFASGALLPLAVFLAMQGDSMRGIMAALLLLFGVTLTLAALNTQRALTESIRLRFTNERLLQRLSSAQQSLEDANHTLERRVAERGAALERQSEALRDAQRMESVGLLAGGVAHDFNNLLTVIIGNISSLTHDRSLSASAHDAMEEINGAASRAAGLVKQLLAFGRRQLLVPKVLDLNTVIHDLRGLVERMVGDHVELKLAISPEYAYVKADPRQLEQVIINLATNARDAMPNGGVLTIATEVTTLGSATDSGPVGASPGEYVLLAVADSGVGMDRETRRQVFDPFFTTKELGKGTGLGLATVHGIVEQSGGHIVVESQPGQGSRFKIYLPRVQADKGSLSSERIETPMGRAALRTDAPARILVAEDTPLVRTLLCRILGDMGHEIIVAENGEQALELARRDPKAIDLLVTDVMMAKMGGLELAKILQAERPNVRLLFVSGYSWDKALPSPDPTQGTDFLQKPFTPRELAAKVIGLLALDNAANGEGAGRGVQVKQRERGGD